MIPEARRAIEREYLDGGTAEECAKAAAVTVEEAETYLRWWCDRGCPGAVTDQ